MKTATLTWDSEERSAAVELLGEDLVADTKLVAAFLEVEPWRCVNLPATPEVVLRWTADLLEQLGYQVTVGAGAAAVAVH